MHIGIIFAVAAAAAAGDDDDVVIIAAGSVNEHPESNPLLYRLKALLFLLTQFNLTVSKNLKKVRSVRD